MASRARLLWVSAFLEPPRWLRDDRSGREWCARIAAAGGLAVLRWAKAQGWRWDRETCRAAAAGGHLDVLRHCLDNGCEWDADDCHQAGAARDHVEVLKFMRERVPFPRRVRVPPGRQQGAAGGARVGRVCPGHPYSLANCH